MDINNSTRLSDDSDAIANSTDNSNRISEYIMVNFHDRGNIENVKKLSLERPSSFYRASVGKVSDESDYRSTADDTNKLTNLNRIHQLAPRLHATIPLMSRGGCDLSVENKLRFIENTQLNKKKTSQSIDRFVPQLDKIKMYQDPKNIIPEDSDSNWVRGGRSSRLIVKDSEISERCGTK